MKKYYVTDKEVAEAERMLRAKGIGFFNGKYCPPITKEDKELKEELEAMGMIHSFVAYHHWNTKDDWVHSKYFERHLKTLGKEKLQKLIDVAISKVKEVKRNVHTDSEGLSYNSIIWKEE